MTLDPPSGRPLRPLSLAVAVVLLIGLPGASPAQAAPAAPAALVTASPTVGAPRVALRTATQLGMTTVPLVVSWPAATPADAPIARYELESSRDGDAWVSHPLPRPLVRTVAVNHGAWAAIRFRVRAVDEAGMTSDWAESAPTWLSAAQESEPAVELPPGWTIRTLSSAWGGRRAVTSEPGATAAFHFTGWAVAWVARPGPGAGSAEVSVDGAPPTLVNLRRTSWRPRRTVFVASFATPGDHTITITKTAGEGIIDIDGFAVLDVPRDEVLVGAGDIASCTRSSDEATAAVAATVEGIVYTTGDNVYPDGTAANYANCYGPSWGTLKERTRPAPGNHDYYNNPGAGPYYDYFGDNAGANRKGWYRYEAGTWRIYALNSECNRTTCPQQLDWLTADLAAEPHRCVLAMWHRPRFSTGPHGGSNKMAALWQLLHDSGADVVLAGHDHSYQRYTPLDGAGESDPETGVRQFIVGTGGASLYAFPTESALVDVRDNTSHGVLRLALQPGSYTWEFLPVPGDTFTDSGTATCH